MSRIEGQTDLWVNHLLEDVGISLDYQSSHVKNIDNALHSASKRLNGKPGYPEYVGIIKDFLIVIEDKSDISNHVYKEDNVITTDNAKIVPEYALNGALHYARHILQRTSYKKCIAIGVSGNETLHKITPLYVNERGEYQRLPDIESFISINEKNIDEYYLKEVLHEDTNEEKTTAEVLKDAAKLHEDLRTYGQLKDTDKPLVVSGILLALREAESHNFSIDSLTGDPIATDGQKIMKAIEDNLKRSNVQPQVKLDKLLNQFRIITDSAKLNMKDERLGMTPLRHYTEFINQTIYQDIRYNNSSEDYLGRFYGEFMSYSGGDGQSLGIILTPKHITQLFCDLVDLKPNDHVFDPTCGTGGFLIAAMHNMLSQANSDTEKRSIRKNQLFGIELQDYMFTIATTNMILRGDGKSNLKNEDFLTQPAAKLQTDTMATVGMMNPPYSQGSKSDPDQYEINFIKHLLDSLLPDARCIVIVPQSTMVGKSKAEKQIKEAILKDHTLEGVITCNPNTFYGVGTNPVIAIFTAHQPHPKDKEVKFIDFREDGYEVSPHVGLVATSQAKDRKQYLLNVWQDKVQAPISFCVTSTINADDEWLHSFYYFNDEIPSEEALDKTIADYLSFEFSMIAHGHEDLFEGGKKNE
ncbi:MAG: class I SAM-dependent DNA methyltransferase [Limosilactobacillus vaginalis]|uniref:HsdM family class I SAM-dependent methyltransferase n=1 Tax=Limosilactobacillus vaginalis TaxID=1633 RepID=UPI003F08640F